MPLVTMNRQLTKNVNNDNRVTTTTTHKAPDTLFTVLNEELARLREEFWYYMKNAHLFKDGNGQNNLNIVNKKIDQFQELVIKMAESGATEDVQAAIKDLQNNVADALLTGNSR